MKFLTSLLMGAVFAGFSGCAAGPDYETPSAELSSRWSSAPDRETAEEAIPADQAWWKVFQDEPLDALIERAIRNNRDLRAAVCRVEASRAARNYAAGAYYPSADAFGAYSRSKASPDGTVQTPESPDPINLHSAGFDFGWEIDLFGKIRRSVESAQASYEAAAEDYHDVMVTVLAEVCRNYIDLRTAQARLRYAGENVELQRKTLELTKNLFAAQIVGELDVRQAESNLANTESEIPTLVIEEAAAVYRLAVLLGETPDALPEDLRTGSPLPEVRDDLELGLPADLIRQRPDIRRAERLLAAQTARIGIATAELYPSLRLTGMIGIQSRSLAGMGNIHNNMWSFGPSLDWNAFDGNRIRSAIQIEKALTQEQLAHWEHTVLRAVEEVNNAVLAYEQEKKRKQSLDVSVASLKRSVELVDIQYRSGLTNFQNVLVTQRALSNQQDRLAASEGAALQSLVRIYKGFGSGWQRQTEPDSSDAEQPETE